MFRARPWLHWLAVGLLWLAPTLAMAQEPEADNFRKPADEAELRYWLGNMVWHHRFTMPEMIAATGLTETELAAALKRFDIRPETRPRRQAGDPLLVLPYPGGRHPRLGFRDGAIRPQRETKVSIFTPWHDHSYVVVDVPEAIWSQHGLLYLAHTHIATVWTKQNITLPQLEWQRGPEGVLDIQRRLPNGVVFKTRVVPKRDGAAMILWLTNGSQEKLSNLRVQVCVLLAKAEGFAGQHNDNKHLAKPYAACRSAEGQRWIITAWEPCQRVWANPPCPCVHSDPQFPDCQPGETKELRGQLWFYEGPDITKELRRLDQTGWQGHEEASGGK